MADGSELELVDYAKVASHIRAMEPRALTPEQLPDVLALVEWMQQELTRRDEALHKRAEQLAADEENMRRREREVAVRARALGIATTIGASRHKPLLARLLRG